MTVLPRWLLVFLGVSVTVNLVGLGWVIGRSTTAQDPFASFDTHAFEFSFEDDGVVQLAGPDGHVISIPEVAAVAAVPGVEVLAGELPVPVVIPDVPHDVTSGLQWIASSLPPGRRETIALRLHAREEPLIEEAARLREIRAEIREELAREEFSKERLETALARLREQLAEVQADSHRVLADVAEQLSTTERAALAGRMTSSIAERAFITRETIIARQAEALARLPEAARIELEAEVELEHAAVAELAAQAEREAAVARDAAQATSVRVYTQRWVLEHEEEVETEDPPR